MGQVRKDILNGWKEIGGYVCRDIRTVERWEKQRGLPVRRVPGAGRATVYALIPELDEWLANTKTTDAEPTVEEPPPLVITAAADPIPEPVTEEISAEPVPAVLARPVAAARPSLSISRTAWRFAAAAAAAVALTLAAWRLMPREQVANAATPSNHYTFVESSRSNNTAPYRSLVPGVDDLYLRAIYSYEQRTPDSLRRSERDFSNAIAKDANYAPAYAGLANTYNLLRQYSAMPDGEAYPKAKIAAERAIALDPRLPQAHASLGFIDFFWSLDPRAAEKEFRTAIALDPSSVLAHHWYGSMLTHEGRYSEALEQLDIARHLEPTSAAIVSTRAFALGLSGHRDEATAMLNDLLTEVPTAPSPHAILATLSLISPRDPAAYLRELRKVADIRNEAETLQMLSVAEPAFHAGGEHAMWLAILKQQKQLHPSPSDCTFAMVQAEIALGQTDQALADLLPIAHRRDPKILGLVIDPMLVPYHKDPRFIEAAQLMGFPIPSNP